MEEHLSAISSWLTPILMGVIGFLLVEGLHVLTNSVNHILQQNRDEHLALREKQAETEKTVLEHELRIQTQSTRMDRVEEDVDHLKETTHA